MCKIWARGKHTISILNRSLIRTEPNQQDNKRDGDVFDCYGILGIVNIQNINFLVTVSNRQKVGMLRDGVNIYEVL